MLQALTSASRARALHILDTRFMVRTSQKYVFKFHKLHKSWRQGQKPTTLEFVAFSQDKDLCVVLALDEYLNRTEEWRRVNNETQLLLSYIQPHKQVVPSTISGWLKNVLKSSGINVSLIHSSFHAFSHNFKSKCFWFTNDRNFRTGNLVKQVYLAKVL